jgi:hypothetical protein
LEDDFQPVPGDPRHANPPVKMDENGPLIDDLPSGYLT